NDYMSTEEPSVAEHANHTKPDKVTPQQPVEEKQQQVESSDKKIVTQNTEDAPEVTTNAKKQSNTVATAPSKPVESKPTVNKNGNITYAQAGRGTTVDNASVIQKCEDAARRAKINPSDSAPDQQRGKVVFRFKIQ